MVVEGVDAAEARARHPAARRVDESPFAVLPYARDAERVVLRLLEAGVEGGCSRRVDELVIIGAVGHVGAPVHETARILVVEADFGIAHRVDETPFAVPFHRRQPLAEVAHLPVLAGDDLHAVAVQEAPSPAALYGNAVVAEAAQFVVFRAHTDAPRCIDQSIFATLAVQPQVALFAAAFEKSELIVSAVDHLAPRRIDHAPFAAPRHDADAVLPVAGVLVSGFDYGLPQRIEVAEGTTFADEVGFELEVAVVLRDVAHIGVAGQIVDVVEQIIKRKIARTDLTRQPTAHTIARPTLAETADVGVVARHDAPHAVEQSVASVHEHHPRYL